MIRLFCIITFCAMTLSVYGQVDMKRDNEFFDATKKWFSAWEFVSKEIYKVQEVTPVEFVFFDDAFVYATSSVTIAKGDDVKGPDLMNLRLRWKKKLHNGSLTLPDKSVIPVNLMSFAAEISDGNNASYFVMPLPDFWKQAGVESKELGIDNLITGVFLHEFSHSQQMQNFGKKISEYEQHNNFDIDFNDDIVQNLFAKNTAYSEIYKKELDIFYNAVKNDTLDTVSVKEGMKIMQQRHNDFFQDKYKNLTEIDHFFLTMEGLGQYTMYLWLTHPKGGNIDKEMAVKGVRRGGKWWSQDEGFALFLILDQLENTKSWAKDMFGNKTESVINLIERLIP
ncbi:hypothetical protein [Empedobacter brevis]|uniref:hypothetical protein n=1 Tax=Empedobacter brevis TaxID=247 RepID=UPI00132FDF03|nr:hypothetical protein [Empedobacter brevis]